MGITREIIKKLTDNNIKVENNTIICTNISNLTKVRFGKIMKAFTSRDNKEFEKLEIGNIIVRQSGVENYKTGNTCCYLIYKKAHWYGKDYTNVVASTNWYDLPYLKTCYVSAMEDKHIVKSSWNCFCSIGHYRGYINDYKEGYQIDYYFN